MILRAIELNYVGPFRSPVHLGPFHVGLNILAAPNESGKSTALCAAARALFDRHTNKSEELKSLQPAGTDLAPRIAVEFETRMESFRIEKTFLHAPRSLLRQWQDHAWRPIAEADAADQRVQELLQSDLPGRGATKPEHWGLLGFLWARQGEVCEWPNLDDAAVGQRIRARLARVEIDPVIERLRARLADVADVVITSTGQSKAGGPLREAEDDLAAIEAELASLRQTRAEFEGAHQRHQQADTAVAALEKEHAEREISARTLRDQALATEWLRAELETREAALAAAMEKLSGIATDTATLNGRNTEADVAREAVAQATTAAAAAGERLAALRNRIDGQQAARPAHESRVAELRLALQRVQSLLRLRQLSAAAATLEKQSAKATRAAARVTELESARAKIPAMTAARVRKLEEFFERVRDARAQLQALGLTVELTPERDSPVVFHDGSASREEVAPAGKPLRLHRPQTVDLRLPGWGQVTVRSGAKEAQGIAAELAAAEARLRDGLQEAEVASIDAARAALSSRKELDTQIRAAGLAMAEQLGDHASLDHLRDALDRAVRRVAALAGALQPTPGEGSRGSAELEAGEARIGEALPAAEKALQAHDAALAILRAQERDAAEALHRMSQMASEQRTRLSTLEAQIADLTARYPEGLDVGRTKAQLEFVQAEARVVATRAELPPEFEKLPDRNRRAAAALQQLANELQARRSERDTLQGTLETLGGQGLYSRETELEERRVEAVLRRDAARTRGWTARIAHDLIEYRKQAATRAVLTPLEERLTAAFAELTADSGRRVFLDERLQIAGLGRTREAMHRFEQLSQGAKEQLLLCLRIAVAQELATEEPQVLILDDVLVNTDSVRQERILDVLGTLAGKLQILILTCHAERYRGVGEPIALRVA